MCNNCTLVSHFLYDVIFPVVFIGVLVTSMVSVDYLLAFVIAVVITPCACTAEG